MDGESDDDDESDEFTCVWRRIRNTAEHLGFDHVCRNPPKDNWKHLDVGI